MCVCVRLLQARLEKEEFEEELKELQEILNTMKHQIPDSKQSETLNQVLTFNAFIWIARQSNGVLKF